MLSYASSVLAAANRTVNAKFISISEHPVLVLQHGNRVFTFKKTTRTLDRGRHGRSGTPADETRRRPWSRLPAAQPALQVVGGFGIEHAEHGKLRFRL